MGEFGVVLMVGGNRPGVTRTLAVAIYDDVQAMDCHTAAARSSLFLLGFAFVVMSVVQVLQRKGPTT